MSQIYCFTCGEKGHTSCACAQWRVNLMQYEDEEEELLPTGANI